MDIAGLKRNTAADKDGQWVTDIPQMDDLKLRVRGLSSPFVMECRARKERKITRAERERDGTLKPDVSIRIFSEVLHEAVLLDWENLRDDGKQIPYDPQLAQQLISSAETSPFREAVVWAAQVVEREEAEIKEDLAKN